MAKVDWKTGKPEKDGVYLTTYGIPDVKYWVVLTKFENGEWETSGDVIAWDYRPEPYEPNKKSEDNSSCGQYSDEYVENLEFQLSDLEAAWTEIHGEMKYYEGASEALLNVIKLMAKGGK